MKMGTLLSSAVYQQNSRSEKKEERVAVRLSAEVKQTLENAAAISGRSLSSFVVSSAMAAAEKAIERLERMRLSKADRAVFLDALSSPPEPNEALKAAATRYRKVME